MKFPELFRDTLHPIYASKAGDQYGLFHIPGREANGRVLRIIATAGDAPETLGWEHVSVSLPGHPERCPSWEEICIVKDLFWEHDACVVQFHPPQSEHINNHAGCLHLWRYVTGFPMPPSIFVGLKELNLPAA